MVLFHVLCGAVQRVDSESRAANQCRPIRESPDGLPALRVDEEFPNGDGSMRRYFLGADEEAEEDGDTGMHLRLLGVVGLNRGSKSIVLFRVAPHAMTSVDNDDQR